MLLPVAWWCRGWRSSSFCLVTALLWCNPRMSRLALENMDRCSHSVPGSRPGGGGDGKRPADCNVTLPWTPESDVVSMSVTCCFLFCSEEVAFYDGNLREKQTIHATFKKLVGNTATGGVMEHVWATNQ